MDQFDTHVASALGRWADGQSPPPAARKRIMAAAEAEAQKHLSFSDQWVIRMLPHEFGRLRGRQEVGLLISPSPVGLGVFCFVR